MIRRAPGVALISFAAVLWGMDALLRKPLAATTSAATIVFGEHVVLVLVVLPLLVPALLALRRAGGRAILAGAVLGAGASALATILFTQAFVHGDPITPVVLQKVQPLVAVVGARLILGEQPRRRFAWFLLPALAGVWLIAFPHPFEVHARGLVPIAEALAAAGLWGLGTVLGRYLGRRLSFDHVVTVRFAFGFVGSALALPLLSAPTHAGARDSLWIAVLALVTGAVALAIYYYGLQRTPAIVASLAELAYPLTAGIVGYVAFGAALGWSQWIGVGLTTAVVTTLPLRGRGVVRMPDADAPLAAAPA
ncbi:MAG TPA: DMT family transporter, partial [Gaiellaceae bacterium]|nr:DMT family transporter [Gaiellaceae bacterium]